MKQGDSKLPPCMVEILDQARREKDQEKQVKELNTLTCILHESGLTVSDIDTFMAANGICNTGSRYITHIFSFNPVVSCISLQKSGLCIRKTKACTNIVYPSIYLKKMLKKNARPANGWKRLGDM